MSALPFPPARLAWTIWGLGALLYLLGFYQRVAPAVITQELSREFNLSGAALGHLAAFYFYSYVAVQIPTGVLADRWGPRRLLTLGCASAAVGMVGFGLAPDPGWANLGRLLVGAGVGVAYVAILKLASVWMPKDKFTLAASVALALGVTGASLAGLPLRLAVTEFGWRTVMVLSGVAAMVLTVAIWWLVRDDPSERGYHSYGDARAVRGPEQASAGHFTADLKEVLGYRNVWLLMVMPGAITGIILTFAGLWGVPFMVSIYGITREQAAPLASLVLIAWAVGGVVIGQWADRRRLRKPVFAGSVATLAATWWCFIYLTPLPYWGLVGLLALLGLAAGGYIVTFSWAKESVPLRLSGTVSGFANVGSMVGGMLCQPLVGWVLDRRWTGTLVNGARVYDLAAYQAAFSIVLWWAILTGVLLLFARDTHGQQTQ